MKYLQPHNSAQRTRSRRWRAGTRRNKRYARSGAGRGIFQFSDLTNPTFREIRAAWRADFEQAYVESLDRLFWGTGTGTPVGILSFADDDEVLYGEPVPSEIERRLRT
jgi:hypothetical protein